MKSRVKLYTEENCREISSGQEACFFNDTKKVYRGKLNSIVCDMFLADNSELYYFCTVPKDN